MPVGSPITQAEINSGSEFFLDAAYVILTDDTNAVRQAKNKFVRDWPLTTASQVSPLWTHVAADATLEAGNYSVDPASGPVTLALNLADGESVRLDTETADLSTHTVTVGTAADVFTYQAPDGSVDSLVAGPLVIDVKSDLELIQTAAGVYRINKDLGSNLSGLDIETEQVIEFTAEVSKEYPVNLSASPSVGTFSVLPPTSPVTGDSFAIFDSRALASNARRISVDFTGSAIHGQADDFAVINTRAGRLEFTYINATVGWRIAASY